MKSRVLFCSLFTLWWGLISFVFYVLLCLLMLVLSYLTLKCHAGWLLFYFLSNMTPKDHSVLKACWTCMNWQTTRCHDSINNSKYFWQIWKKIQLFLRHWYEESETELMFACTLERVPRIKDLVTISSLLSPWINFMAYRAGTLETCGAFFFPWKCAPAIWNCFLWLKLKILLSANEAYSAQREQLGL